MLGIYYIPQPTICYETGLPPAVVLEGIRHLGELGFAYYDPSTHYVFVPEMARFQIGERLSVKDNQRIAVVRSLAKCGHRGFAELFFDRYRVPYHLQLPSSPPSHSPERIPRPISEAIFERDAGRCRVCSREDALQIDHVLAKVLGGVTEIANLQVLCASCALKKASQDRAAFWERHAGLCRGQSWATADLKSDSIGQTDQPVYDRSNTGPGQVVDLSDTSQGVVHDRLPTTHGGPPKGVHSGAGSGAGTGTGSGAVADRSRSGPPLSDRNSDTEGDEGRKVSVSGIKTVLTRDEEVRLERICRSIEAKANGEPRGGGFRGEVCASRLLNAGLPGSDVVRILLGVLDDWLEIADPWAYVRNAVHEDHPDLEFWLTSAVPGETHESGGFSSLGSVLRSLTSGGEAGTG